MAEYPDKIVFCLDNSGIGGSELNAVRTAERLSRAGFSIEVCALGEHAGLIDRYERSGVPVHVFPMKSLASREMLTQGYRLLRLLRELEPDVFHGHDTYGNIFGVPWARLAGVTAVLASRRWGRTESRRGHRVGNRLAYRLAHSVVANSASVAEVAREVGGKHCRVEVVPNFIDDEAFREPDHDVKRRVYDQLGIPRDRILIGCVANLRPVKDHATLLKAVSILVRSGRRVQLLLVGEGQQQKELMQLARTLDIGDQVVFAGFRSPNWNLHYLFDISTLSSEHEGLPNTLLEAMAAERPVVATRVGGVPDAVTDGEQGLLVPSGDPEAMAEALDEMITDPAMARRMGRAGKVRAQRKFSPAALGELIDLYRRLVSEAGKRGRPDDEQQSGVAQSSTVAT